jgi:hypothetical protein
VNAVKCFAVDEGIWALTEGFILPGIIIARLDRHGADGYGRARKGR